MKTKRPPDTTWLDNASEQGNRNVTMGLAFSYLEMHDPLDAKLGLRHDPHRFDAQDRFEKRLEFGWN